VTGRRFRRNLPIYSLRHKLIVAFTPVLLGIIVAFGFFSFEIASRELIGKVSLEQHNLARKAIVQFDYMAQSAKDFTDYLLLSNIADHLLADESGFSIDYRQTAFRQFSSIMVTHHSFQSMILYKLDDMEDEFEPFAINQTGITSAMPYRLFRQTPFYAEVLRHKQGVWMYLNRNDKLFVGDSHNKIIFAKIIKNSSTFRDIGILILGIDEQKFRETIDPAFSNGAEVFLVSKQGEILTSTDNGAAGQMAETWPLLESARRETGQWIVSESRSEDNGWTTVVIQRKELLLEDIKRIRLLTIATTLVCFLFGVIMAGWLSSTVVKPIGKLLISMKALQKGDFTQQVPVRGKDELAQLGRGYNIMVQRIKELIDDVYQSKIRLREAELKTLQAQVNPHFLYNTLNTICWTAQKRGQHDLADMVYSLSQVFRLSLSDGRDLIPLRDELELVRNYLSIQQARFQPRFAFELDVPPSLFEVPVPKLSIQPLVENAVIHGIEPLGGNGFVQVRAYSDRSGVHLEVQDNGAGIPADKLAALLNALQSSGPKGRGPAPEGQRIGWALLNIQERLSLKYGEKGCIEVQSVPRHGTRVIIHLPLPKELG